MHHPKPSSGESLAQMELDHSRCQLPQVSPSLPKDTPSPGQPTSKDHSRQGIRTQPCWPSREELWGPPSTPEPPEGWAGCWPRPRAHPLLRSLRCQPCCHPFSPGVWSASKHPVLQTCFRVCFWKTIKGPKKRYNLLTNELYVVFSEENNPWARENRASPAVEHCSRGIWGRREFYRALEAATWKQGLID